MQNRNDLNQPPMMLSTNDMSIIGGLSAYTSMTDIAPRAPCWILNPDSMIAHHINSRTTWGDYNYKTWAMEAYHQACLSTLDVLNSDDVRYRIDEEQIQDRLDTYVRNEIEILLDEYEDSLEDMLFHYGFKNAINFFRFDEDQTDDITVPRLVYTILWAEIRDRYREEMDRYDTFIIGIPPAPTPAVIFNGELTCGECFICKEDECLLMTLPCNHKVGKECYIEWFDTCQKNNINPNCPLCRAEFER